MHSARLRLATAATIFQLSFSRDLFSVRIALPISLSPVAVRHVLRAKFDLPTSTASLQLISGLDVRTARLAPPIRLSPIAIRRVLSARLGLAWPQRLQVLLSRAASISGNDCSSVSACLALLIAVILLFLFAHMFTVLRVRSRIGKAPMRAVPLQSTGSRRGRVSSPKNCKQTDSNLTTIQLCYGTSLLYPTIHGTIATGQLRPILQLSEDLVYVNPPDVQETFAQFQHSPEGLLSFRLG